MIKLKRDKKFEPCAEGEGDELFANGVFTFNITRLVLTRQFLGSSARLD